MENLICKFSIDEAYRELEPFMIYLSGRYANDDIMFNFDELFGELQLELVKGYNYYWATGRLQDLDQFFAVLRRMMDNRIAELRYKHYSTHRGKAKLNISIDIQMSVEDDDTDMSEVLRDTNAPDPEQILESMDRVIQLRNQLSVSAQEVMDLLIQGSPRLDMLLQLTILRSIVSGKLPKIRPAIIANAMLLDEAKVEKAFKEIKNAYAEVCHE